mgnify:CR=1 FL=1
MPMRMLHQSTRLSRAEKTSNFAYSVRIFLSSIPLAVATMFGLAMIFWPSSAFPESYDFMFSIAPKYLYGIAMLALGISGFWAVSFQHQKVWQRIHNALAIAFFFLASLFVVPGSITGVSTYSIVGAHALLHGLDLWLPIGFVKTNR